MKYAIIPPPRAVANCGQAIICETFKGSVFLKNNPAKKELIKNKNKNLKTN